MKDVYNGKFIQVKEQTIDGTVWERVYLRGGIVVYPITDQGKVLFVQEFRPHETPQVRIKPVTGIYEDEYSLEENANREMQEEIGYKAGTIELILEINSSGTINNFQKFVVAKDLVASKIPNPDGEHTIQKIIEFDIEEIYQKLLSGEIPVRNSTIGIFKLYSMLQDS